MAGVELPARGQPMPRTPEQYERMHRLFNEAFLRQAEENRQLRVRINQLEQRLQRYEQETDQQ